MKRLFASLFALAMLPTAAMAAPVTVQDVTYPQRGMVVNSDGSINVSSAASSASTAGVAYVSTTALAANKIIKASAGNLYSFEVAADSTLSAAAWWLMIYDAVSAPVDGAVTPAKCYAFPAGTTGYTGGFHSPAYFATGVTMGVSTTGCFTKTASTHAFMSAEVQ